MACGTCGGEGCGRDLPGRPDMYWMIILKWILTKSITDGRINVTRGRNKWLALVNKIVNLLVPQNAGNFFTG